jgi:hypothetical protein
MLPFLYRFPTTGLHVQEWSAEEVSSNDNETYEAVKCLACGSAHLVNRSTRRTLGHDPE